MMENNYVFIKKEHIKTHSKKKDVIVIFILQETKNSNLFDKNCTQSRQNGFQSGWTMKQENWWPTRKSF